jgi:TRAP-type C4-dicarboxylate transport system substrate-binding protein
MEPDLEKRLADKGFVVLFWGDAGWVRFFSKAPAYTPEDFKKMKVFVTAGDNNEVEIMKAAGYKPVALEWTDTLISLQTGLIDAVPAPPFLALAGQYNTVTRHMLEVDWVPLVGATVITKKAWDALSVEARDVMRTAAAEAGQQIQARSREESNESVAAMQKRGLQIHTMTPEMEAKWCRLAESVYPKIRGKMVPADMFDEVQRLLAEYRAEHNKGQS